MSHFNVVGKGVSFMPLRHGSTVLNVLSSIPLEKAGRQNTFWFEIFTFQFSLINVSAAHILNRHLVYLECVWLFFIKHYPGVS